MIISSKEITLQTIKDEHLPMLRKWRNSERIAKYMEFQNHISESSQKSWFQSISNDANLFFVISYKQQPIGLIQLQTIDYTYQTAESGLYIAEDGFNGLPIGFMASLPLLDFAFSYLKLKVVKAKTHIQNQKAIAYNEKLGFQFESKQNALFNNFCITGDQFFAKVESEPFFVRLKSSYAIKIEKEDRWHFELTAKGVFINEVI